MRRNTQKKRERVSFDSSKESISLSFSLSLGWACNYIYFKCRCVQLHIGWLILPPPSLHSTLNSPNSPFEFEREERDKRKRDVSTHHQVSVSAFFKHFPSSRPSLSLSIHPSSVTFINSPSLLSLSSQVSILTPWTYHRSHSPASVAPLTRISFLTLT